MYILNFKVNPDMIKHTSVNFQIQPESCCKFDMLKVCLSFVEVQNGEDVKLRFLIICLKIK